MDLNSAFDNRKHKNKFDVAKDVILSNKPLLTIFINLLIFSLSCSF